MSLNNNAIWTDGFYGFCLRADVASELTDSRHPPQIWSSSAHGCALCKKLYIQTREYPGALELCNPTASPPPPIDVSSLARLLQWSTRFTNLRRGRSVLLQNLCKFSFSLSAKMSIGHPHLLLLLKKWEMLLKETRMSKLPEKSMKAIRSYSLRSQHWKWSSTARTIFKPFIQIMLEKKDLVWI